MTLTPLAFAAVLAFGQVDAPSREQARKSIERGRAFLSSQQKDGRWGYVTTHPEYSKVAYGDAAVTALALTALWRSGGWTDSGKALAAMDRDALGAAKDAPTNLRMFALAYGLLAQLERGKEGAESAQKYVDKIAGLPGEAGRGLNYSDSDKPATFELALLVWSLSEARRDGLKVPEKTLEDLRKSLERTGKPSGGDIPSSLFPYKDDLEPECFQGGAGRNVLCEFALMRAKEVPRKADCIALWNDVRRHVSYMPDFQDGVLKDSDWPHIGADKESNYYYYFSAFHTSEALRLLDKVDPDDECRVEGRGVQGDDRKFVDASRANLVGLLAKRLVERQQKDGSWQDSALAAGPVAGTAFAVLALVNLEPQLE